MLVYRTYCTPRRKANSLHLSVGPAAEVLEQKGKRGCQFSELAAVEAFVGGVGFGARILDAHAKGRGAAEQLRERADEADRAAATDRHGFDAVAALERGQGRLER